MKIEKRFSKIYYCGNNVQIFSTAKDDGMEKSQNVIKKIDESYDSNCTTKVEIEGKTRKLFHSIDIYAKKSCYHSEIFKYGKIECKFCKPIRMPKSILDRISQKTKIPSSTRTN